MKSRFAKVAAATGGAFLGLVLSAGALAMPISVSYEGVDISVLYDIDEGNSQKVTFEYLFQVGDAASAANWIGTTMDALSLQFGSVGKNDIISSISGTSANSANVNGDWTGFLDKVSGQGCAGNNSEAACYTRLATAEGGTSEETVIAADTDYSFVFDVIFNPGVVVADVLAGEHSIKFLSVKEQCNPQGCKWSTGLQLSESGEFHRRPPEDPPEDPPVPLPGTLLLLGLGLLGLRFSSRVVAR